MKRVSYDPVVPVVGGPVYGKVSDPNNPKNEQIYLYSNIENLVRVLLMNGAPNSLVEGFALALTSGLSFTVQPGLAFTSSGKVYDSHADPVALTLAAAHATLPRIDLVYISLEDDVPESVQFRPYQRLRTLAELQAGTAPYLPQEFEQPQEVWNRATIQVRQGTPNASPSSPAAGANEVALFQVRVNAAAVSLSSGNVTDERHTAQSLAQTITALATLNTNLAPYLAMLDAATALNVINTLMKRDANGDVATRDIKPARQIVFPDTSIQTRPRFGEQQVVIFDLETPFSTTNAYQSPPSFGLGGHPDMATVERVAGFPFYLNLIMEDFLNIPLVLEVVFQHVPMDGATGSTSAASFYSVTDAVGIAACSTAWGEGIRQARSSIFYLTGTGRKRFNVRVGAQYAGPGVDGSINKETRIYAARLIAYPSYSNCGNAGQSVCTT